MNCFAALRAASSRVGSTSVRLHRARDVERQHDRRLLAGDVDRRVRTRDTDDHRRERDQEHDERDEAELPGLAVDHVRHERGVPEARGDPISPPVVPDVEAGEERDEHEPDERERPPEAS